MPGTIRGGPAVAVHQVLSTGFYKFTAFSSGGGIAPIVLSGECHGTHSELCAQRFTSIVYTFVVALDETESAVTVEDKCDHSQI